MSSALSPFLNELKFTVRSSSMAFLSDSCFSSADRLGVAGRVSSVSILVSSSVSISSSLFVVFSVHDSFGLVVVWVGCKDDSD